MFRFLFYTVFIGFLLFILPIKGEVRYSNPVTETMFLRGDKLGVTFPWGGVLIKKGLEKQLNDEVLLHELCHVEQAKKQGITFFIDYINDKDNFESECYEKSMLIKE